MSNRLLPLANWLPAARLALALATARYPGCLDPFTPPLALVFQCCFATNPEWEKGKPRCPPLPPSRAPHTSAVQGGLPHPANRGTPDSLAPLQASLHCRVIVAVKAQIAARQSLARDDPENERECERGSVCAGSALLMRLVVEPLGLLLPCCDSSLLARRKQKASHMHEKSLL